VPALSNDFFRFIWDGELITNGINPYAHKPDDLISFGGFLDEDRMRVLYHGMGELSQQSYSCYPPLNQLFFVIPAALSDTITTQLLFSRSS
jgi:alpha-1,6-mannosyltransferase